MLATASVTKINVFGVGLPKPEIKKPIDFTFPLKPNTDKFPVVKPYLING